MAYKRKTRDVYNVEGDYGSGFEIVCSEESWTEAKARLREYRDNEPYRFRIKVRREKIAGPTHKTTTFKIRRFYQDSTKEARTIKRGLTLDEAQAHCNDPETSSRTATSREASAHTKQHGAWFDGYTEE